MEEIAKVWKDAQTGCEVIIEVENNTSVSFMVSTDKAENTQLGRMKIVYVYEEKYLLSHSVINGM